MFLFHRRKMQNLCVNIYIQFFENIILSDNYSIVYIYDKARCTIYCSMLGAKYGICGYA
jgi:hypothetical protein